MYTPPNSDNVRKPKEKHTFVIQLDYMIVYTHTRVFVLFQTYTYIYFQFLVLGNI